jgi:hypothetical protein
LNIVLNYNRGTSYDFRIIILVFVKLWIQIIIIHRLLLLFLFIIILFKIIILFTIKLNIFCIIFIIIINSQIILKITINFLIIGRLILLTFRALNNHLLLFIGNNAIILLFMIFRLLLNINILHLYYIKIDKSLMNYIDSEKNIHPYD